VWEASEVEPDLPLISLPSPPSNAIEFQEFDNFDQFHLADESQGGEVGADA
jgi:hypothetical protein